MSKLVARTSQVLVDLLVLGGCLALAFLFRFDWELPYVAFKQLVITVPYVIAFQYGVLSLFGVPRFAWRYIGLRESLPILKAIVTAAFCLFVARLLAPMVAQSWGYAKYAALPIGVITMDLALSFLGITGVRVLRRLVAERADHESRRGIAKDIVPTLLVGAGQAGLLVAKELTTRPDLGMDPVGFLDDDRFKVGTVIHGIPVLGSTAELATMCKKHGARQVLITIANTPGKEIRRIKELCDAAEIPAKIIPGVYEIVGGKVNLTRIRSVTIEDLLGREPVQLELDAISASMRGRTVVVTGAGGSIGSEICRQVCQFEPAKLLLVEQAENSLFHIHRELIATYPALAARVVPVIADITDPVRLEALFREHRPEVVFHAAAHKHVPMMEWNPGEAVKNNVFGTRLLADVSHAHGVRQFVMISTDKAVNPTSVMGCSKRIAEIYVQALSRRSETRFVTVRFGNVLGSAGSVIPIFQEQIAKGGPVTVTHPEMKRYFMTIPEACQLVLQAGTMGKGGEIFILDMGEPVKIVDLARDLIRLSGFKPDDEIEIQFTGIRPGEKLFEELSVEAESAEKTKHPKIFIGRFRPFELEEVVGRLVDLRTLADSGTPEQIRARFRELVPEYTPVVPGETAASPQAEAPPDPAALRPAVAGSR